MSTLTKVPEEALPAAAKSNRTTVLLFWLIPCIPSALILMAFLLVRTSFFRNYMDSDWIAAQRVVFETSHRACDIVIFGDSTAMVGLDPVILERQTGLSTCNIGAHTPHIGNGWTRSAEPVPRPEPQAEVPDIAIWRQFLCSGAV